MHLARAVRKWARKMRFRLACIGLWMLHCNLCIFSSKWFGWIIMVNQRHVWRKTLGIHAFHQERPGGSQTRRIARHQTPRWIWSPWDGHTLRKNHRSQHEDSLGSVIVFAWKKPRLRIDPRCHLLTLVLPWRWNQLDILCTQCNVLEAVTSCSHGFLPLVVHKKPVSSIEPWVCPVTPTDCEIQGALWIKKWKVTIFDHQTSLPTRTLRLNGNHLSWGLVLPSGIKRIKRISQPNHYIANLLGWPS